MKDKSKLTAKKVVDKTGKRTTVWVKNGEDDKKEKSAKKEEPAKKPKSGNEETQKETHMENPFKDMATKFKIAAAEAGVHRDKFLHQNGLTIDDVRRMTPEEKAGWNGKYSEHSKENPHVPYEGKEAKKEEEAEGGNKDVIADLKKIASEDNGSDEKKEEKGDNYNFSTNKDAFFEQVSRARKVYDNSEEGSDKKAKAKDFLVASKEHKKENKDSWSEKDAKDTKDENEEEVVADLKELAKMGQDAKKKGEKAPNFNLCKVSIPNTNLFCDNNKGIKRENMPQLKGAPAKGTPAAKLQKKASDEVDGEALFQKALAKKGVKIEEKEVKADTLKATQNELVGVKVGGMMMALENDPKHAGITAPILVSKDGYVLDGHHRWAAIVASEMNTGKPPSMSVKQVDMNIEELVKFTNEWTEEFGIKAKAADANKEVKRDLRKK